MDKTISLQTAIDALYKHFDKMIENGHRDNALGVSDSIFILGTLPSAQPEIIRCKDCKHYNAGFECLIEGYGIERDNDWYCADAERRTDENNNSI